MKENFPVKAKVLKIGLGTKSFTLSSTNEVGCHFIYYTALASETKLVVSFTNFPVTLCLFVFSPT